MDITGTTSPKTTEGGDVAHPPPGSNFGYGNWLQPIINANDRADDTSTNSPSQLSPPPPLPQRRGRGRPPVARPRDSSAIEKRRAQVREAQRTYQKRKESASATEKRRADELLQLLFDLSGDVESLLQAASSAGIMNRNDEVSKTTQRLWSTYDTVINNECVNPELRLLQVKNARRVASHKANNNHHVSASTSDAREDPEANTDDFQDESRFDPRHIDFQLVRFEGTTVMSSFQRTSAANAYMEGKNIFQIVQERQAALKAADRRHVEHDK